ncbi:MAG: cation:proton antiporter, partial [Cyanobacteria bacterium J06643_5]
MLKSFILILVLGFFIGQIAQRFKVPALVGMVLVGIVLGPQATDLIDPNVLAASAPLRTIAVMVILMKAGLGLDREKLVE